ncbi:hypothetical protein DUI87_12709 [Hirundo rustica rustica]|uniref:Uncharacterized protein n=1 Tax=Hirundo rustica rustica TaxID=333673 RepID=A0A3M0K9Y1_HIRRU|nr:hypothetical protein DUI87_12709 [Hirundo rustica rustica]
MPRTDTCKHKYPSLGGEWVEKSPEEKELGILADFHLDMTWQHVLAAQKANCILGCIKRSVVSRLNTQEMMKAFDHLHSPSLDSLQYIHIPLVLKSLELDPNPRYEPNSAE